MDVRSGHPHWIYGVDAPTGCCPSSSLLSSLLGGFTAVNDLRLFLFGFFGGSPFLSLSPRYHLLLRSLLSFLLCTTNFSSVSFCVPSLKNFLLSFKYSTVARSHVRSLSGSLLRAGLSPHGNKLNTSLSLLSSSVVLVWGLLLDLEIFGVYLFG